MKWFEGKNGVVLFTVAALLLVIFNISLVLRGPVNISKEQIAGAVRFVHGPAVYMNLLVGIILVFWGLRRVRAKKEDRFGPILYGLGLGTVLGIGCLVFTLLRIRALS